MIPLFRKVRKKLADDNQFFKYSRYAIGEIVLVVIGILIALQINNWNEERLRDNDLNIYMNNMIRDLDSDIQRLSMWGNSNKFRYNSLQHILVLSGHNPMKTGYGLKLEYFDGFYQWNKSIPNEFDADFVSTAFEWSLIFGEMSPNLSTMKELENNGMYSYIKNNELKASINNYYSTYQRLLGLNEDRNVGKYRADWLDSLTQNGYNAEDLTDLKGAIDWLNSDQKATARLKNIILNAKWRYQSADSLIVKANNLIELIKNQKDH